MKPLDRIKKARIALLLDEPFFGSLLMHLKLVQDPSVKTFQTDSRVLQFSPQWLETLSDPELRTVLAHEVLHCALCHPFRVGDRDPKQFNIAADYAVNNFLDRYNQESDKRGQAHPFPLERFLVDHTYDDLSAEEIYDRLQQKQPPGGGGQQPPPPGAGGTPPPPGQGPGQGQPPPPGNQPGPGSNGLPEGASSPGEFVKGAEDEAEAGESEAEWKVALQQACMAAKAQGRLPGDAERLVKEFLDPAVPWREVLRTFLTSAANDDYSWTRPNRRYSGCGVVMPSLHSPRLGKVVIAVDTSGSIDQEQFDRFIAEARAIMFDCRPTEFVLAQCDSRLTAWDELEPFDDFNVQFKGGGGTDFCPVFDRAAEDPEPPAALIYLTDMIGTFPDVPPPYPVLWAATTSNVGPFGNTIHIS